MIEIQLAKSVFYYDNYYNRHTSHSKYVCMYVCMYAGYTMEMSQNAYIIAGI